MRTVLLLLLALAVLAGGVALYLNRHLLVRPNIARTGGTYLTWAAEQTEPPCPVADLLQAVNQRIDPTGVLGITAEAEGDSHIVTGIPFGPRHDENLERVKELLRHSGQLELRVLAAEGVDAAAVAATRAAQKAPGWPESLRESLARTGVPPAPRGPGGEVELPWPGDLREERSAYAWVPVGDAYLRELNLTPAALVQPENLGLVARIEAALRARSTISMENSTAVWLAASTPGRPGLSFFVLSRLPARGERVTGDLLLSARAVQDAGGEPPAASLRFSPEGTARLLDLTSRVRGSGLPGGQFHHLGILLDGQLQSAPYLRGALRSDVLLTGSFTPGEVANLVAVLRSGALPARLKPEPVRVTTTDPAK